ncbi:hypothetical protein GpartN1_g6284.t1 [Galdieria partita]|uniref:DNA/RNA-binding protein Alba-like domain-containing protein n=1 Tax=Galdieria partita TaxID=83374 RepID=A0A9C7Q104_9RHOD|nr:hypothetical protein GpartN1_g6284.t1 [Galdieria partita]
MEKYRRVERAKSPGQTPPNQIRITAAGKVPAYVDYAIKLLQEEKTTVEIVGLGNAINKAITVAEILKRKVPKLEQVTDLSSVTIEDRWEPLEEGLDPIETSRTVSCLTIQLGRGGLDTRSPGYQAPEEYSGNHVDSSFFSERRRGRGRGGFRGGRGTEFYRGRGGFRGGGGHRGPPPMEDDVEFAERDRRGPFRGRARGSRGRGGMRGGRGSGGFRGESERGRGSYGRGGRGGPSRGRARGGGEFGYAY